MAIWDELGPGVARRRYESLDLNVGIVVGSSGSLVVDTRASHRQADVLRNEIARFTTTPVRWVVNTHWHWDHTFGNARFGDAVLWGHELCARRLATEGATAKREAAAMVGESHAAEIEAVVITPPRSTFVAAASIDLGDRRVELLHLGRGHTDGDIVVVVPDAGVVFAGDLLEEGAPPYFGDGFPLAWPETVRRLEELVRGPVVPGHGDVMTAVDVVAQRADLAEVAAMCRRSIAEGIDPADIDFGDAPFPVESMRAAFGRARLELGETAQGSR